MSFALAAAAPLTGGDQEWLSVTERWGEEQARAAAADVAEAKGALAQANAAKTKAVSVDDQQALPIAERAIALAQSALESARRRLKAAQSVVTSFKRALGLRSEVVAVTARIEGSVSINHGDAYVPMTLATVIHDGETIRTGNGTVEIFFKDGGRIELKPYTSYTVDYIGTVSSLYRLLKGSIRRRQGAPGAVLGAVIRYRTPTAIAAVRGTEFDLDVDDHGIGHVRPASGTVVLIGMMSKADIAKLDRWWLFAAAPPPKSGLVSDAVARVVAARGQVIVSKAGQPGYSAAPDDTIADGDQVATETGGAARLALSGGQTADLGADTTVTLSAGQKANRIEIKAGLLHVARPSRTVASTLQVTTSNTTIATESADFVAEVKDQAVDIVAISGRLEVKGR